MSASSAPAIAFSAWALSPASSPAGRGEFAEPASISMSFERWAKAFSTRVAMAVRCSFISSICLSSPEAGRERLRLLRYSSIVFRWMPDGPAWPRSASRKTRFPPLPHQRSLALGDKIGRESSPPAIPPLARSRASFAIRPTRRFGSASRSERARVSSSFISGWPGAT